MIHSSANASVSGGGVLSEVEQKARLAAEIARIEAELAQRQKLEEEIKAMEAAIAQQKAAATQHQLVKPVAASPRLPPPPSGAPPPRPSLAAGAPCPTTARTSAPPPLPPPQVTETIVEQNGQKRIVRRVVRKVVRKPRAAAPVVAVAAEPPPEQAPCRPAMPAKPPAAAAVASALMPMLSSTTRPPMPAASAPLVAAAAASTTTTTTTTARPTLTLPERGGHMAHHNSNLSTHTNLERMAGERDYVASQKKYAESDDDESIEEEVIDDDDDEIIEEVIDDDDNDAPPRPTRQLTPEEQLAAEIAAIEQQLQQATAAAAANNKAAAVPAAAPPVAPPPRPAPPMNLMASIGQAAQARDDRLESGGEVKMQQPSPPASAIMPPRLNLMACVAQAATSREKRLEETGGEKIMKEHVAEVAVKERGPMQLSTSMAEMISSRAAARDKRLAAGGEKKMTVIKEKAEYKKDFSNIVIDAAAMGRLTRLNEHTVEAVAGVKTPEEQWKSQGLLAIQWRSNHMAVIHDAAKAGNMAKLPEKVVSNFPELEEEEEWDPDAKKRSPRMMQLLALNQQVGEGQQKVDKLVLGRKEENAGGDSMLIKPMVCYSNIEDVKLPKKKPPKVDPKKTADKLKAKLQDAGRPMLDISVFVAEKAWERRTRLDRPGGMPKVTEKCDCPYCLDPTPYQTFAYKELERRKKEDGYESVDSAEERRREHQRRREERRKAHEDRRRQQEEQQQRFAQQQQQSQSADGLRDSGQVRRPRPATTGGLSAGSNSNHGDGPERPRRPRPMRPGDAPVPGGKPSSPLVAATSASTTTTGPTKKVGSAVAPTTTPLAAKSQGCACVIL